jgi:Transposase
MAAPRSSIFRRKHGISDATYYEWKAKYHGMEVNELKRLKQETESRVPSAPFFDMSRPISLRQPRLTRATSVVDSYCMPTEARLLSSLIDKEGRNPRATLLVTFCSDS